MKTSLLRQFRLIVLIDGEQSDNNEKAGESELMVVEVVARVTLSRAFGYLAGSGRAGHRVEAGLSQPRV